MIVKYTNKGGYDHEREEASKILDQDTEYVVCGGEVHGYSSSYILEGVEGEFNVCMFDKGIWDLMEEYGQDHFFSIVKDRC